MKQTAQVTRLVRPGYAEVKVRRASACAGAHNCGSCDHCSFMENAPEILVVAEDACGVQAGDTVIVESGTAKVLGAAVLLYIVPIFLFFVGYFLAMAAGCQESGAIALGGGGFALGLLAAVCLDRYQKKHQSVTFRIVSREG